MKKRFQLSFFAAVFMLVFEILLLIGCIRTEGGFDPCQPLCYFLFGFILLTVCAVIDLRKRIRMIDEAGEDGGQDFWLMRDRRINPKRFWIAAAADALLTVFCAGVLIWMMIADHGFDPEEPLYYAGFGFIALGILSFVIGLNKRSR